MGLIGLVGQSPAVDQVLTGRAEEPEPRIAVRTEVQRIPVRGPARPVGGRSSVATPLSSNHRPAMASATGQALLLQVAHTSTPEPTISRNTFRIVGIASEIGAIRYQFIFLRRQRVRDEPQALKHDGPQPTGTPSSQPCPGVVFRPSMAQLCRFSRIELMLGVFWVSGQILLTRAVHPLRLRRRLDINEGHHGPRPGVSAPPLALINVRASSSLCRCLPGMKTLLLRSWIVIDRTMSAHRFRLSPPWVVSW